MENLDAIINAAKKCLTDNKSDYDAFKHNFLSRIVGYSVPSYLPKIFGKIQKVLKKGTTPESLEKKIRELLSQKTRKKVSTQLTLL